MILKKTNEKFLIGQALVKEGIINEKQLQAALDFQRDEFKKGLQQWITPLGNVINHLYHVPIEQIEDIFFRHYLIDLVRDELLSTIINDRFLRKKINFEDFIDDIEIQLINYRRLKAETVYLREHGSRIVFESSECHDYRIQGLANAVIKITNNQSIDSKVHFTYTVMIKHLHLEGELAEMGIRETLAEIYDKISVQ